MNRGGTSAPLDGELGRLEVRVVFAIGKKRLIDSQPTRGQPWLSLTVVLTVVSQTAIFDPVGLFGIVYWYSLFPLHEFVFRGMLRNICKAGVKNAELSKQ